MLLTSCASDIKLDTDSIESEPEQIITESEIRTNLSKNLLTQYTLEFKNPITESHEKDYEVWLPDYESNFINESNTICFCDSNFEGIEITILANYITPDLEIGDELSKAIGNDYKKQVGKENTTDMTEISEQSTNKNWITQGYGYEWLDYTKENTIKTKVDFYCQEIDTDKYILIQISANDSITDKAKDCLEAFKFLMKI